MLLCYYFWDVNVPPHSTLFSHFIDSFMTSRRGMNAESRMRRNRLQIIRRHNHLHRIFHTFHAESDLLGIPKPKKILAFLSFVAIVIKLKWNRQFFFFFFKIFSDWMQLRYEMSNVCIEATGEVFDNAQDSTQFSQSCQSCYYFHSLAIWLPQIHQFRQISVRVFGHCDASATFTGSGLHLCEI